jgi:hypothetical protein
MLLIDSPNKYNGYHPSLAIKSNGDPFISFSNTDTTSTFPSVAFTFDVSRAGGYYPVSFYSIREKFSEIYTSAAIKEDVLCYAFLWTTGGEFKYACDDFSGVDADFVDFAGGNNWASSLALDNNGKPHIGYWYSSAVYGRPAYARTSSNGSGCDSGGWDCQVINFIPNTADETMFDAGYTISTALVPSTQTPSFSFFVQDIYSQIYSTANGALSYVKYVGTGGSCSLPEWGTPGWDCQSIGLSNIPYIGANDLVYSPGDTAQITYEADDDLYLWTVGGTSQKVDGNLYSDLGGGPLAMDTLLDGKLVIAYYDSPNHRIKLAFQVASGGTGCTGATNPSLWTCLGVDSTLSNIPNEIDLAVDSTNKAWISYYDGTNQRLKYSSVALPAGTVTTGMVDSTIGAGLFNSIDLYNDIPTIAYSLKDANTLWIATYMSPATGNCGTGNNWQCTNLASGVDPSIKINSQGWMYISYSNRDDLSLRLARMALPSFIPLVIK